MLAPIHASSPVCGRRVSSRRSTGAAPRSRRGIECRAQWITARSYVELPVGLELAWDLWNDKKRIPHWMPEIVDVEVDRDDATLSHWALGASALGQSWTFEWSARDLAPVHHQKIHWVSEPADGELNNKGSVRFSRRGNDKSMVSLEVSFEAPGALLPFAPALSPVAHAIVERDMERFRTYAIAYASGATGAHQVARPDHRAMARAATPRHPFMVGA